jgi:glyoxylase-like metal-dependent hydrolase (beta-lactamase superfamily II)
VLIYQNDVLKIHRLLLNNVKTNCLIVQKGNEAILVDPSDQAEVILDYLRKHQLTLKYMIATHGHFDHIMGAAGVIESGLVDKLYIHEKDFNEVKNAKSYCLMIFKRRMRLPQIGMFSSELFSFLRSWGLGFGHVGGHTMGSCYIFDFKRDFLIAGDLVLNHKLNLTMFDYRENTAELFSFIEMVKKSFHADTVILPGHGDNSTVGIELVKNKKWVQIQRKGIYGH